MLVTGVSTGIGYAIAKLLTAEGYHVFGTVRKSADADRLAGELGSSFTPLLLDITDENAIATAAAKAMSRARKTMQAGKCLKDSSCYRAVIYG